MGVAFHEEEASQEGDQFTFSRVWLQRLEGFKTDHIGVHFSSYGCT